MFDLKKPYSSNQLIKNLSTEPSSLSHHEEIKINLAPTFSITPSQTHTTSTGQSSSPRNLSRHHDEKKLERFYSKFLTKISPEDEQLIIAMEEKFETKTQWKLENGSLGNLQYTSKQQNLNDSKKPFLTEKGLYLSILSVLTLSITIIEMRGDVSNFFLNYINIFLISTIAGCLYLLFDKMKKQQSQSIDTKKIVIPIQCLPDDFASALIDPKKRICWDHNL